jgi:preprotein translocase subunit SecD
MEEIILIKKSLIIVFSLILLISGCASISRGQVNNLDSNTTIVTYQASNIISKEAISLIVDTLNARFKDLGFNDIVISQIGSRPTQVQVHLSPYSPELRLMAEAAGQPNSFKVVGPHNEIILTEKDIKSVRSGKGKTSITLDVQISSEGKKKLLTAAKKFPNEMITIYLDDNKLSNPTNIVPINDDVLRIPSNLTVQENDILAKVLNSGKTLPFKLNLISVDHS